MLSALVCMHGCLVALMMVERATISSVQISLCVSMAAMKRLVLCHLKL